jgi:hypothetical protein
MRAWLMPQVKRWHYAVQATLPIETAGSHPQKWRGYEDRIARS